MSKKLYEENNVRDIADAIREQNGTQNSYTVAQMGNAVRAIKAHPDLEALSVTENGNYVPSAGKDGFSHVIVNVSGGGGELPTRPALPDTYQEVQYVHFNSAYFTVTSVPFYVGIIMLEAEYDEGTSGILCGYRVSSASQADFNLGTGGWYLRAGGSFMDASSSKSGNTVVAKGLLTLTDSIGSTRHFYVGNYNPHGGSGSNLPFSGKMLYFAILKPVSNEWAMYCIPCYRKSDNVVGMYDAVNSTFYTPPSGTFTAGPDVN